MYETSFPASQPKLRVPKRGAFPLSDAIIYNSAVPVLLPTVQPSRQIINSFVDRIDGLILGGGDDISPTTYGEQPLWPSLNYPLRDQFETAMVYAMLKAHKPILGICRGCQMLNVALGGSLYQNIYQQIHRKLINHENTDHQVFLKSGSHLFKILGRSCEVNSRHHQAIRRLGKHLKVVARAADSIVEGVENQTASLQGVQWHPENLWQTDSKQNQLFKAFLERCHHCQESDPE